MKNFYEANKKDIKKVKGIGEVLAKELIEKKEEIIDYYDLQAIKGVGKKVYQNFKKKFYIIREDYGCGACPYVKIEKPEIKCLEKDSSYDITTLKKASSWGYLITPKWCPHKRLDEFFMIEINKIDIPEYFVSPKGNKVTHRKRYYEENGEMDNHLVVEQKESGRYLLRSGYTRYLAGKELGLEKLRALEY